MFDCDVSLAKVFIKKKEPAHWVGERVCGVRGHKQTNKQKSRLIMERSDKGREWAVCTQKANYKTEQWRGQNRGRKHRRWKQ